jgi:hypothetical protein
MLSSYMNDIQSSYTFSSFPEKSLFLFRDFMKMTAFWDVASGLVSWKYTDISKVRTAIIALMVEAVPPLKRRSARLETTSHYIPESCHVITVFDLINLAKPLFNFFLQINCRFPSVT